MIKHAEKAVSIAILLLGIALVAKTVVDNGTVVLSTHMIAGLAFMIYGGVRFHYLRGT